MLRRNRLRNSYRRPLGRSKSTSSIPRKTALNLQNIDPIVAERDAHIAAVLSYSRAHGLDPKEMTTLSRDHSSLSIPIRKRFTKSDGSRVYGEDDDARSLHYRECRARGAMTRSDSAQAPHPSISYGSEDNRASRPGSRPGSDMNGTRWRRPENLRASEPLAKGGSFQAFDGDDEYWSFEDQIVTVPSSYRRIRKSRSMFVPLGRQDAHRASDRSSAAGSQAIHHPVQQGGNKENKSFPRPQGKTLRTPKSMSFLKPRKEREAAVQTNSRAANDIALQLARERFLDRSSHQSHLSSQPSSFLRSRIRRTDSSMGFRKSLRKSSNNSTAISSAFSGDTVSVSKQGSLRITARKVSQTVRTKIKGLFGRHKSSNGDFAMSNEQVSDDDSCFDFGKQQTDDASMSRGPSRMASLHAVQPSQQLRSRQGSLESCGDDDATKNSEDRSRVTSWTDSTTNTIASHSGLGEWERQRLSVIKENGAHISSNTLNQATMACEATPVYPMKVDSDKIYEALMKKISQSKQNAQDMQMQMVEDIRFHGQVPPRGSSVDQLGTEGWSPRTIRRVTSDDDVFNDKREDTHSEMPTKPAASLKSHDIERVSENTNDYSADHKSFSLHQPASPRPGLDDAYERSKTVSHRSSAFFASPSCHLFRTTSPFRRALQENMQMTENDGVAGYMGSLSAISLPTRRPSPTQSENPAPSLLAESIYSPVPQGMGNMESSTAREAPQRDLFSVLQEEIGPSTQNELEETQQAKSREPSAASSVEWKTWLSANVSKLESTAEPSIRSKKGSWARLFPKFRHVRENAEIDSPGEASRPSLEPLMDERNTPCETVQNTTRSPSEQRTSYGTNPRDENVSPRTREPTTVKINDLKSGDSPRSVPSLTGCTLGRNLGSPLAGRLAQSASLSAIPHKPSSRREELLMKRRARSRRDGTIGPSTYSSSNLAADVEKQFGKVMTGSPASRRRPFTEHDPKDSSPTPKREILKSYKKHQESLRVLVQEEKQEIIGRQRMVDLFLDSRRAKGIGSQMSNGSDSSPAAFL